jgi:hypothetical protein
MRNRSTWLIFRIRQFEIGSVHDNSVMKKSHRRATENPDKAPSMLLCP